MSISLIANILPWSLLFASIIYLVLVAWLLRIYPNRQVLWLSGASLLISIAGVATGKAFQFTLVADLLIVGILVADQITVFNQADIRVSRIMQRTASIRKPHWVKLILQNHSSRTVFFQIKDDDSQELHAQPDSHELTLRPKQSAEIEYCLRPSKRGSYRFEHAHLRQFSLLRFWSRFKKLPCEGDLNVYPDMQQLGEYAILARTNRLSLIGVRRTRRIGQDNNFERLRDYNQDDNYKHIDWRCTARRNKLTVKEFQSDQSQRVMFLLDCGRMMTSEYNGLSMVDHALNSILMLSYVALSQGDSVGMMAFSDRVHSFVPMRSGKSQMNRLIHAGFDRFAEFVPTRFDQAFLHFNNHCRRRSMVFLITNVIDEVSASEAVTYISQLSPGHLPVLSLLRDHRVFDYADNPDEEEPILFRSAAAANILLWRADIIRKIQRLGILAIDTLPKDLTSPMVNQYLAAKAKHLL